jgi:hypothetical protein
MSMDPNEPGPEGFAVVIRSPDGYHRAITKPTDILGCSVADVWVFGSPMTKAQNDLMRAVQPAVNDGVMVHYISAGRCYDPPQTPLRRTFDKDQMVKAMTDWLVELYGHPKGLAEGERGRWHERNGMMHHFITDLFDK